MKDYTCRLLNDDYLEDLFKENYSGVDKADIYGLDVAEIDFISEVVEGARREAMAFLDDKQSNDDIEDLI